MTIPSLNPLMATQTPFDEAGLRARLDPQLAQGTAAGGEDELKLAFRQFVGTTFFSQMLSSMRETTDKPAYFHGGQAEEIFSEQLDQVLVDEITESSAAQVADPMYELFNPRR